MHLSAVVIDTSIRDDHGLACNRSSNSANDDYYDDNKWYEMIVLTNKTHNDNDGNDENGNGYDGNDYLTVICV